MPYKDKEQQKAWVRAYNQAHRAECSARTIAYNQTHPEERKETSRKYRESYKARITEHRIAKREFIQSLFAGQVCVMCGGGERLVFHHVDPATKCFNVGNADTRSEVAIRAEVAKCIILCRSCHSRLHEPTGLNARFLR